MQLPVSWLRSFAIAAVGGLAVAPALAESPRAVVELFTSQGCASCPPADRLLATLGHRDDLLTLSFPVDYWDWMGWKDTLAAPAYTARQKGYSLARGDGEVYTPQVVVDGMAHAVGSDAEGIRTAIAAAPGGPLSVPIRLTAEAAKIRVEVGSATPPGAKIIGAVWLLRVAKARTVKVGRGENAGKTLTYTNVVRGMRRIGDWTGVSATFEIPAAWASVGDGDGYVILLQAGTASRPGAILAAAKGSGL